MQSVLICVVLYMQSKGHAGGSTGPSILSHFPVVGGLVEGPPVGILHRQASELVHLGGTLQLSIAL